jgi:hypothetical protein
MVEELEEIDDYDSDEKQPFVFAKANKYTQIFIVGLLVGAVFFGIYLIGYGIFNMYIVSPQPVANGTLSNMMCYSDSYYKSDKRNELAIVNCGEINAKSIWIGTPEEYQAWVDMKLLDDKKHFFTSKTNSFLPNTIFYPIIMRYYPHYENLQIGGYSTKFIIVTDGDKRNATTYEANIGGNQSNPIFTIKNIETNLTPIIYQGYYQAT